MVIGWRRLLLHSRIHRAHRRTAGIGIIFLRFSPYYMIFTITAIQLPCHTVRIVCSIAVDGTLPSFKKMNSVIARFLVSTFGGKHCIVPTTVLPILTIAKPVVINHLLVNQYIPTCLFVVCEVSLLAIEFFNRVRGARQRIGKQLRNL